MTKLWEFFMHKKKNETPLWLNKKQVCQRLGNIGYSTLDYFIKHDNFPKGFKSKIVAYSRWYIPTIEQWEWENSK